jgi:hypothetical protein
MYNNSVMHTSGSFPYHVEEPRAPVQIQLVAITTDEGGNACHRMHLRGDTHVMSYKYTSWTCVCDRRGGRKKKIVPRKLYRATRVTYYNLFGPEHLLLFGKRIYQKTYSPVVTAGTNCFCDHRHRNESMVLLLFVHVCVCVCARECVVHTVYQGPSTSWSFCEHRSFVINIVGIDFAENQWQISN